MICLKLPILIVQRLDLLKNGVEFLEQFNGAIGTSVTAPYDDTRSCLKFVTYIHTHIHTFIHHGKVNYRVRLP